MAPFKLRALVAGITVYGMMNSYNLLQIYRAERFHCVYGDYGALSQN